MTADFGADVTYQHLTVVDGIVVSQNVNNARLNDNIWG